MTYKKFRKPVLLASMAALAISSFALVAADETTGTATVTGGSLTMLAPSTLNVGAVTLDGTDQTITNNSLVLDVNDATGTGAGWKVDIAATQFSDGGTNSLAVDALKVTGVTSAVVTGTDATNSVEYPLTVTGVAASLFNAAVDTGMGDLDVTPTFTVDIPAETYAATYSSTITTTVSTGP